MISTLSGETIAKLVASTCRRANITENQLFYHATRIEYENSDEREAIASGRIALYHGEGIIDEGVESFCLDILNDKLVVGKARKKGKKGGLCP